MRPVGAAALLLVTAAGEASAQGIPRDQRPAGVTDSAIAWGRELFHGSANCAVCHGEAGRGTGRGPNITGAIWLHGPGTYESLIEQVKHGVPASRSYTGEAMPERGMVPMPEDAVRAVAAYVWSISHPRNRRPRLDAVRRRDREPDAQPGRGHSGPSGHHARPLLPRL